MGDCQNSGPFWCTPNTIIGTQKGTIIFNNHPYTYVYIYIYRGTIAVQCGDPLAHLAKSAVFRELGVGLWFNLKVQDFGLR